MMVTKLTTCTRYGQQIKGLSLLAHDFDLRECKILGTVAKRLAAYEDTGLTPEQIEAQQQEIDLLKAEITELEAALEDRSKSCIIFDKENTKLIADKDEQAGRIMRLENLLYQAKDMLQMGVDYLNHDKPFDPLGSMKIAIKAIDALLGGNEDV